MVRGACATVLRRVSERFVQSGNLDQCQAVPGGAGGVFRYVTIWRLVNERGICDQRVAQGDVTLASTGQTRSPFLPISQCSAR